MSTKTTFKRIALVAVAALGLGVLSVAPSNAAVQLDSIAVSAASATQVAGSTTSDLVVTIQAASINTETMTVTASIKSGPAFVAPKFTFVESTTAATTGTTTSAIAISGRTSSVTLATAKYKVYLDAPTVVGTYVIALTPTGHVNAVATTVSIVVSAKTLGWSSAFIGAYSNGTTDTATADATISTTGAASTTAKARIDVGQGYGATSGSDTATAADAAAVVVATDKGLVSKTNDYTAGAKSVTDAAGTDPDSDYYVFSNGDVGKASITITIGGVLKATKTVTFTGPATAIAAALTANQPAFIAGTGSTTYTITATDAGGTAQATLPTGLTVKSSDTSVATAEITSGVVTVTGVKAGTSTITVTDPATTGAAPAISFVATVAPVRPTAVDITFDAPSYNVGDLITMTVSANMGDSATAQLFSSTGVVFSAAVVASGTAVPTGANTYAIVGGKATYKFYAPAVSGSLVVTATTGGAVDVTTAVVISKTVPIANPGVDAATDAANEAYDAANAATDAALAAAEAADAATVAAQEASDAVAALSESVTKLIAGLQAQIKSLAAVVAKIAKKVKA